MRYRTVGRSGLAVSVVGLGCNNFGKTLELDAARAVCNAALDCGITLFNTGDTYGRADGTTTPRSEGMLGTALRSHRDEVVIATKFGNDMFGLNGPDWDARGSRRYVRTAVERSLRMLQTDWIDLYEIHNPDPRTPIEETLSVLDDLIHEGKIRYAGASNFAAWQLVDADWTARARGCDRFVSVETEYSLLRRDAEKEIIPACTQLGIGLLPYFPLAHGLLTGKYRGGAIPSGSRLETWGMPGYLTEARLVAVERLHTFAEARSISTLDLAIGGLAAEPCVSSVIAGATTPEQVRANAQAGDWVPDAADLDEIRALGQAVEARP
ncbi:MAG TPA: aldo/keto reductase [Acidimicrobiales bacterium]|nr:aldo/keto reductase [Acidimicrobiales bacterium]